MSIFTKKSRPKEADAVKSKHQHNASNGSRTDAHRAGARQAGPGVVGNGALTAGQRTVQRAQIMAASRVRMNSDSPDYSITGSMADLSDKQRNGTAPANPGSVSGAASMKSSKTAPRTLTKAPPNSNQNSKQRQSSPGLFPTKSAESTGGKDALGATLTPPQRPEWETQEGNETLDKAFLTDPSIQKTPPMPMDSPTLGYTPKEAQVQGNAENQPSRNAAYAWVAKLPVSKSRSSKKAREDKSDKPRVDSGFVPGLVLPKEFVQEPVAAKEVFTENKSLRSAPSQSNRERESSRGSLYVSRWDPGPSASEFAKAKDRPSPNPVHNQYGGVHQPSSQNSLAQPKSQAKEKVDRGRQPVPKPVHIHTQSTIQRDVTGATASTSAKTQSRAIAAEPPSPLVSPLQNLQSPFSQPMRPSTPPATQPSQTKTPNRDVPQPYAEPTRSSTPPSAQPRQRHTPVEDPARTFVLPVQPDQKSPKSKNRKDREKSKRGPKSRDSATLLSLTGGDANWPLPAPDSAPPPNHALSTPRAEAPEPVFESSAPIHSAFTEPVPKPQAPEASDKTSPPNQASYKAPTTNHRALESITSNATTTGDTLPPLSVLAGFKVNKRGLVLDEEGDAVGELFEGDLIDCVRQRVNDNGEVFDEYGAVVGRVRTISRSVLYPPHQSEMGQFASMPRGMSPSMASATSERRESTTSTPPLLANGVHSGNNASTAARPSAAKENVVIAELDGSTDAEAIPIIDQSEIFIPPFGGSKRSESPVSLSRLETGFGLRSKSQPREPVSAPTEHKPKKWASRYFDPGPQDGSGTPTSRRNSVLTNGDSSRRNSVQTETDLSFVRRSTAPTDLVSPIKAPSPAAWKQPQSPTTFTSPGGFKAVLGPTLEDLGEEQPSINRASASTPNLGLESSRWRASSPTGSTAASSRRTSIQYPNSSSLAPGLSRASYQPLRKSPLASYETTPPGSGSGPTEPEQKRALSMKTPSAPAAARPHIGSKSARVSVDFDDAAPSPEILKTKAQLRGSRGDTAKTTATKRKSRFSFLGGK